MSPILAPARRRRRAAALIGATGLTAAVVAGGGLVTTAEATEPAEVAVVMTDAGFQLPAALPTGWVTFHASTPDAVGHQLEAFRPHRGVTVAQVVDDIMRAASPDPAVSAAGTRDANRDAEFVGGPAVDPVTPVAVTVHLDAGRYYFFDFNDPFTPGQRIRLHRVVASGDGSEQPPQATDMITTVMAQHGPRFGIDATPLHAGGITRLVNLSTEIHELLMGRVERGTTNADVSAYYASGSAAPPPYAAEPGLRGVAAISPGEVVYLHYDQLPPGRYVLLCYAADEQTGAPHVVEGMHAVASFR